MATWPSAAQLFDNLNLKGPDANSLMRAWYQGTLELLGALPAQGLSILNGTITPARAVVVVDTEGGAPADDLTLISPVVSATDTLHDGMLLCLKAQVANRVITVRHSTAVNGIRTADGQAVVLGADWWLTLRREGGAWHEMPLSRPVRVATAATAGIVRPDGRTCTVDGNGVLTAVGMIPGGCVPFSGGFGGAGNRHPIPRGGTVPDTGWVLCDGGSDGAGGTVPDLRDRFIVGAGPTYPSGSKGGSATHTHGLTGTVGYTTLDVNTLPRHTHSQWASVAVGAGNGWGVSSSNSIYLIGDIGSTGGSKSHTHSLNGSTAAASNIPSYYALAYIMRL